MKSLFSKELWIRSLWTLLLLFFAIVIILAGHFYFSLIIFLVTIRVYLEILWISLPPKKEKSYDQVHDATSNDPVQVRNADMNIHSPTSSPNLYSTNEAKLYKQMSSKDLINNLSSNMISDDLYNFILPLPLHMYLFTTSIIAIAIPWIVPRLKVYDSKLYRLLKGILSYYPLVIFSFFVLALIMFTLSLKKNNLKRQFLSLAITIATMIYVIPQSLMSISNIYTGMIWFIVQASCVVSNDLAAYFFGKLFGKSAIISVSPKKTVEGFIGATVVTIIWSIILPLFLIKYKPFLCRVNKISIVPFEWLWTLDCDPAPIFQPASYRIPSFIQIFYHEKYISIPPFVFHSLVIGIFSSLISPFGGFFASGLKRAMKVKDFPAYIPGHGGLTDRFDCQIITSSFTFLYIKAMTKMSYPSVQSIIRSALLLSDEDRLRLINELHNLSFVN